MLEARHGDSGASVKKSKEEVDNEKREVKRKRHGDGNLDGFVEKKAKKV